MTISGHSSHFPLALDPQSAQPLVAQIVEGIRHRIDHRLLRRGMRLPPIRRFAAQHGVSRFTVVEAYDRLVAMGLIRSRRGAGFFVDTPLDAPTRDTPIARDYDHLGVLHHGLTDDPNLLKTGAGWLPEDWIEASGLRRHLRRLAGNEACRIASYGTAQGFLPLRHLLQLRYEHVGVRAPANQILLTQGASQALDLCIRGLLHAGDCVLVDDPGYWILFAALRLAGIQVIGVPRTEQGPDPTALEALAAFHKPRLFFTQSVLQNPTSHSLGAAVAHQVLRTAEAHGFLIVEDDIYSDFHPGEAIRLAQLDQLDRVISIGSFSKTLSGNLRVGYLAARPDLTAALTDVKLVTSVASAEIGERLIHQLLSEGHYRKWLERLRGMLARATDSALRQIELAGFLPATAPEGGMFIWAAHPSLGDTTPLAAKAAQAGIMLAPGSIFRPQGGASPYLRLNVAYCDDPRLDRFLSDLDSPSLR